MADGSSTLSVYQALGVRYLQVSLPWSAVAPSVLVGAASLIDLFEALLTRLMESVDRNPRRLRLIYVDPRETARLEADRRIAPARNWRRGIRRWEPADYIRMYEILPAARLSGS